MPFIQKVVEPKFLCRRRVWPKDDGSSRQTEVDDELELVVNVALCGALRQLSSIATHADTLFKDLRTELDAVRVRTEALRTRMDSLEVKALAFNPRTVAVRK
ncbi:actin-binding protein WASF2-like [Hetaerina americana]|uniref:actin-binding protein WASF2-like n=1 Tax=Hetaerina americana TaxID=62018 RepID=UPI003A7F3F74